MEIRNLQGVEKLELPVSFSISFKKIVDGIERYASDTLKTHPFHQTSKVLLNKIEQYPELISGFSDFSLLEKHNETIDLLLAALFPEILSTNEIKTATIPFSFTSFKFTERFKTILENAGEDYELKVRNFEDDTMYIFVCTFILNYVYKFTVDLKRPFYFDIPDRKLGITKHYKVAINADFMEVIPTDKAPLITEEDFKLLLENFDNIALWKEKFPPESYVLKGFAIMNLFDVSVDETLTAIRTNLLRKDDGSILQNLQKNLSAFFAIRDLKVGYSVFDVANVNERSLRVKRSESILIEDSTSITCKDFFCDHIIAQLFKEKKDVVISDITKYGAITQENAFYKRLKNNNIGSIILLPISTSNEKEAVLLEIAAPKEYQLNTVNKYKLKDILPVFEASADRNSEEFLNVLEATIQEHYTSIHSSVKWRFYEAAEKYQQALNFKNEDAKIEEIVFPDVYPLYGQIDVKGSSEERNKSIKEDLSIQLNLAIKILKEASALENLPIYKELNFRVKTYLTEISSGLKAGDEVSILDFLKKDIYPVFNHLKKQNNSLKNLIQQYMDTIDPDLHVVYHKRKLYEESVTKLNDKLAKHLDNKQEEVQEMFPHYFERYKTDGVEYNMYIGKSLTKIKTFDFLYLYNLRLWQLQNMCELENIAHNMKRELPYPLEVASLILVHSNSLSIKFRMEEKQFDVDGAYNIRYEIIKKRIDKAHLKNSNERLTIPNKIAIVYSQDKDAEEYTKYIKYLQSKNILGSLEHLELEDLQGVSGLKALRVEVVYHKKISKENTLTVDQILSEIKKH